jgi:hypothetical protein
MPLFLISRHKQCILSNFIHNSTALFISKSLTLSGLLVPEADAMSTAPRR